MTPVVTQKGSNRGQRLETTGRPQTRPVLGNPIKHGTFAILNRREVLAKNASGSDMKNLTIASRGFNGALDQLGVANVSIRPISNFVTLLRPFA